ncbi:LPXTG cell wall anchor domain-containing protein [Streptococcus sp. S784/96/1]|uniref:LPXTG cell wall anchor domain-containing protein n=1 Tax=Streptococcus sp. S784/96/1 TaxID=2653499 RepID=UPI00138A5C5F|nr:LPXTG cell wall anchor domain-containing protein [Streptococcus sp. S784/96/1]
MIQRQIQSIREEGNRSKSFLLFATSLALIATGTSTVYANDASHEKDRHLAQEAVESIQSEASQLTTSDTIEEAKKNMEEKLDDIDTIKEEKETIVLEASLSVDPIVPGDTVISGTTTSNAIVDVKIDEVSQTSVEDFFVADEKGKFSLKLERPISYNQKIEIVSTHPKIFEAEEEDDFEGGEAQVVITTPRHPEAYPIPTKPLQKVGNQHQVLVEPLFEGAKKIQGHTSVEGTVYAMIGGTIVSKPARIKDGYFEIEFSDDIEASTFKTTQNVKLSFISNDGLPVMHAVPVYPLGETLKEKPKPSFTYQNLTVGSTEFSGMTEPFGRVKLYDAETGNFVLEAWANEEGKYSEKLPALASHQRYYRLFVGLNNDYQMLVEQTVDGADKKIPPSQVLEILDRILFDTTDVSSPSSPLQVPNIHDQKEYIAGRSKYAHHFIRITSSVSDKKFPTIMTNELGFWGIDFRDLEITLEQGEQLTFEVIDPKSFAVMAKQSTIVKGINDGVKPEEHSFVLPTITSVTGYVKGQVAPNVRIFVHQGNKLLAESSSTPEGDFEIDFGETVLEPNSLLTFTAFNEEGRQVLWNKVSVKKGEGKRIRKPEEKSETQEKAPDVLVNTQKKQADNSEPILQPQDSPSIDKTVENKRQLDSSTEFKVFLRDDQEQSVPFITAREPQQEVALSTVVDSKASEGKATLPRTNAKPSLALMLAGLVSLGAVALTILKKKQSEA